MTISLPDAVRADTPGCLDSVFLDSAGSSLPPRQVVDAVVAHLRREAEVGGYRAAAERVDDLAAVKESIGRLVGASPSTIALSDSATRSWCDFFYAIDLSPGDRILVSTLEYASNAVAVLQRAAATGAVVEVMPVDSSGIVDVEALEKTMDDRVAVVSVVHAPTNGGALAPVRAITEIAHRHGALVLLDACQSIGQMAIDVGDLGVDAMSATGRKWLRGPRGTGFLYVSDRILQNVEPRSLDLHSATWTAPDAYEVAPDARRFEVWENNVAARLGLGVAVDYLLELGVDAVESAVRERAEYLRSALAAVDGVTVHDLGEHRSGIVTFTTTAADPAVVRSELHARDISVTVSSRSSTRLDMTDRDLEAVVRMSPHCFVSFDQLDVAVAAVAAL